MVRPQHADNRHAQDPAVKRRKIRKGTVSCWQCKRQKARCELLQPDDEACVACKRRGLKCVRQDEPEQPAPAGREDVLARLVRVEDQIQQLLRAPQQPVLPSDLDFTDGSAEIVQPHDPQTGDRPLDRLEHHDYYRLGAMVSDQVQPGGQHAGASYELISAWPTNSERDAILTIPYKITKLASLLVNKCIGMADELPLYDLMCLPPTTSHPASYAKKLLTLGIVIQGVVLQGSCMQHHSKGMFAKIMTRVIHTATRFLATDNDLAQSVEGVQCIALESMYHNNAGRLRDAWLAIRRAVAIAQLIGVDKAYKTEPARALETSTSPRLHASDMWLSLVQSDQYLSMMLGLSNGVSALQSTTPEALALVHPFERLERIHCIAANLILQRSGRVIDTTFNMRNVDCMLKDAAACMPASWWLPADAVALSGFDDDAQSKFDDDVFVELGRVMKHLTHFHLVIQLHLPDLLRHSTSPEHIYSKITAINTSRNLLSRYNTFRNASTQSYWYCRGIDLLALIASTVLCLGHILIHNSKRATSSTSGSAGALEFLAHQRLPDRGLLDSVLAKMRALADGGFDKISVRILNLLEPLLAIEAEAATGMQYELSYQMSEGITAHPSNGVAGGFLRFLRIHVPCSGVVQITPKGAGAADSEMPLSAGPTGPMTDTSGVGFFSPTVGLPVEDLPEASAPTLEQLKSRCEENAVEGPEGLPTLPGNFDIDLDDWTLEGVDANFFDNLLRGTSYDTDNLM